MVTVMMRMMLYICACLFACLLARRLGARLFAALYHIQSSLLFLAAFNCRNRLFRLKKRRSASWEAERPCVALIFFFIVIVSCIPFFFCGRPELAGCPGSTDSLFPKQRWWAGFWQSCPDGGRSAGRALGAQRGWWREERIRSDGARLGLRMDVVFKEEEEDSNVCVGAQVGSSQLLREIVSCLKEK